MNLIAVVSWICGQAITAETLLRNATCTSNHSSPMNEIRSTVLNVQRIVRVEPMANHAIVPPPQGLFNAPTLNLLHEVEQPMWKSLFRNVKEALFPEKLPPLRLTSRPVQVGDIWPRSKKKRATAGSLT